MHIDPSNPHGLTGILLAVILATCAGAQCGQGNTSDIVEAASPAPAKPSAPATPSPAPDSGGQTAPAADAGVEPVPPAPLLLPLADHYRISEGWLGITARVEEKQRAWIEGRVQSDDRIILDTSNIAAFHLDLSRIRVNWEKRILLRIDGFNSELSRRRWPVVYLTRTATGAWKAMDSP